MSWLYFLFMRKIVTLYSLLLCISLQAVAQEQGFFLNSWQPKTFTAPSFTDVAKPATAATVTITFDTAASITKVSKYLFGNNANPYMTQMVTEPVLLDHIKNLSPNIIRFPGGNISSVFIWNALPGQPPADMPDSLYDQDGKRVAAGYWYGKNADSWTLSTDNYYSMLQQTNNTGIITVNYSYARYSTSANPVQSAAHLAADWVRYDNGRTQYWEIGNEDAGPWQAGYKIDVANNKDGQPEIITGALYGQHFKVFVDSMKKAAQEVGSTIYIGAQLIAYDATNSWIPAERNWNSGFFSSAGNTADFFIVHSYYTPFNENSTAAVILSSAATETKNMMDWLKTSVQQNNAAMKPVALTEWNIFAVGSKQQVSHINGLHAVLVLGELLKNKYGMASRWDLANGWSNGDDHGTFSNGDEPSVNRWTPRPAFYHMYYFQEYFGDQMISSTVSGSTDIVAYASKFSSGEAGVIIVNKGTTAQTVRLSSSSYFPGNRYYWYTLTGDNDNGEFSRKVLINGTGPAGVAGGPTDYSTLKAGSATSNNDVRITVPPRSSSFVVMEKSNITAVNDIDPANKLIKIFPNPARSGKFVLSFTGLSGKAGIDILSETGQLIYRSQVTAANRVVMNRQLSHGVYFIKITLPKGITVKRLVVE